MHIPTITKLPKQDRRVIAESLMELGNIAGGSLLFNQVLQQNFNIHATILGFCLLVLGYNLGIHYLKGD